MDADGSSKLDSPDEKPDPSSAAASAPVYEKLMELLAWWLGSEKRARIFIYLRQTPARTSGEIADGTELYSSTVRATVAAMHEKGLLTRKKRSRAGRGNNPYEYIPIRPTELVEKRASRIQDQ